MPGPCSRDHPRLRGEHQLLNFQALQVSGAPPPTRGTPLNRLLYCDRLGITPAYAGNTDLQVGYNLRSRDHPRLRGEHIRVSWSAMRVAGSPPPTRGTPTMKKAFVWSPGITPAYAGNTGKRQLKRVRGGDHPRLRGEHKLAFNIKPFSGGSPPPTRGTLNNKIY